MSFKDTQSYKELQSDWRWIHEMDPEAAAAADQWVKEHPEEWKELEHMLYYSEANFHKRVAPDTLEDLDIKQPRSYNPEAFLPEEVRNAIYNDRRWFDRSKYLPEGSDEDPFMYLDTQIYDALHALTELQREILFRTIINGESTESVAQDKQCSSRNIRDILNSTIQRRTNLHEYLCGNMPVPPHLGDRCWANTCLFTQVLFLHVLIDEQLPEFFITHRHKISPPYRYTKKCSAAWQSIRSIAAILPRPIPTLDSVVYNDSTFGQ